MFTATYHQSWSPKKWPWEGDCLTLRYETPNGLTVTRTLNRVIGSYIHQAGHPTKRSFKVNDLWRVSKPWVTPRGSKSTAGHVTFSSYPRQVMEAILEEPGSPVENFLESILWLQEHEEACVQLFEPLVNVFNAWEKPVPRSFSRRHFRRQVAQRNGVMQRLVREITGGPHPNYSM